MASLTSRSRRLARSRTKRMKLMVQCQIHGIPAKIGHHSQTNDGRTWHGPTTLSRMRRKLLALEVNPVV